MTRYSFKPVYKMECFSGDTKILETQFNSIEDGLRSAKADGTLLREKNWEIIEYKCLGFLIRKITLRELFEQGFLDKKVNKDEISEYYHFKE